MARFIQSYDPHDIARFFSNEDSLAEHTPELIRIEQFQVSLDEVLGLLPRLPDREADLIFMYYVLEKKQIDIARIFVSSGKPLTQAAISYRLSKGIKRLKFLLDLPKLDDLQMREDLENVLDDPLDVEILVRMYRSTCQSVVARELDLNQGFVRNHFVKSIEILKKVAETNPVYSPYAKAFTKIAKNFNILHEIVYTNWDRIDSMPN